MGIKNLTKLLKTKYSSIYEKQPLSRWENKTVAVDSSIYIYKFKSCAIKDACFQHVFKFDETTKQWDEPTSEHINNCYRKRFESFIDIFKRYHVTPIFVFDGKSPEEKKDTKLKRREKVQSMIDQKNKMKLDVTKILEYKNILPFCVSVQLQDFETLYQILEEQKIQFVKAQGEAEHLCAHLCKEKKVDAVVSTDTDLLAYGCPVIWNQIVPYLGTWIVEMIQFSKVLEKMEITEEQFLCLCIMCGTDFNKNVKSFGPARCLKLIQDFKDFETIKTKFPIFDGLCYEKTYEIMKKTPQIMS